MKKILFLILILTNYINFSQVDYSNNWEDFYSYNNVKDFVKVDDKIYAIVNNALFVYNINTQTNKKTSSVNGLSGESTSAIFYDQEFNRILIGYETGLLEIIDQNGTITVHKDIINLNQAGSKKINHFTKYNNKLYLATDFAVIQYDVENLEFGDTYFIGSGSTSVKINQTEIINDTIYAATQNGIYYADINSPFLIDFNIWQQPQGNFLGNFTSIDKFNDELYVSKNTTLYKIISANSLQAIANFSNFIINCNASNNFLTITTLDKAFILNENLVQLEIAETTTNFDFELNNAFTIDNRVYLATSTFGILTRPLVTFDYQEIHPAGPLFNDVYSIEVLNNNLWVVYGGASRSSFNSLNRKKGFSHFNGEDWLNTPYSSELAYRDLVDISIDPFHENRVFISSYYNGMLEVVNDEIVMKYDQNNSDLELRTVDNGMPGALLLVSGTVFDNQGNLWVANGWTENKIKKLDTNGLWTSFNIEGAITSTSTGLGNISIDNLGNKWLSSRDYGAIVFNENGELSKSLTTTENKGKLPDNKVYSIIADRNNQIWIGTDRGFVVFRNAGNVFEAENYEALPVLIQLEGATGEEQAQIVLDIQKINTIAIDGADNKWFGTGAGVLGTNPSGKEELHLFTKDNSPLPSNEILKIKVDNSTGKVYFATTKGIVAFNNNVAPFGETLGDTYAYPNPSTSSNEFITIDGRNGTHLPRNTNVKILDSAGYLVHETNVVEGAEIKGGKVIWNKTNLAGRKVASGIYIVLLTLPDKSETSITKIAIIK